MGIPVGHVNIATTVRSDTKGTDELPITTARRAPLREERPVVRERLDTTVAEVRHVHSMRVDRHAARVRELPVTGAKRAPLREKRSTAGEFLDSVVVDVRHVNTI